MQIIFTASAVTPEISIHAKEPVTYGAGYRLYFLLSFVRSDILSRVLQEHPIAILSIYL